MYFVYLDEFGHDGPFVHRQDKHHNTSPVFGLSGLVLPEQAVRPFARAFLELKQHVFSADIEKARAVPYKWEKKGSDIFRPKAIERYPALRQCGFRLLNTVRSCGGKVFYHGREKIVGKIDGNSMGLYTTILAHTIRRIDTLCQDLETNFVLVVDQHSARRELLDCAAKTMYGTEPARRLLSPPFEVESYLNQTIQAADWIGAIVGRLWAYELQQEQYSDHERFRSYYWDRLHQVAVHSSVTRRRPPRPRMHLVEVQKETAITLAFRTAGLTSR